MLRLKEVDALAIPTACAECGRGFTPLRSTVSGWLRAGSVPMKKYCSRKCSGVAGQRVQKYAGAKKRAAETTATPRTGHLARTEHNVCAKFYCVRSPDGVVFKFRNLFQFVRDHADLFPPGYATEFPVAQGRIQMKPPKASSGLRTLFSENPKHQRESYLGWVGIWKKDRLGKVVWRRAD